MKGVVYYELLKLNQAVIAECYQQLLDLNCTLNKKRLIIKKTQSDFVA